MKKIEDIPLPPSFKDFQVSEKKHRIAVDITERFFEELSNFAKAKDLKITTIIKLALENYIKK